MPIYEYDCRKCGEHFEVLLRKRTDTPKACPKCGARGPVKAFSAFSVASTDPTSHCETCPTAETACARGTCASGACPFSGAD